MAKLNDNSTTRHLIMKQYPDGRVEIMRTYEATTHDGEEVIIPHDMSIDGICGRIWDGVRWVDFDKEIAENSGPIELTRIIADTMA